MSTLPPAQTLSESVELPANKRWRSRFGNKQTLTQLGPEAPPGAAAVSMTVNVVGGVGGCGTTTLCRWLSATSGHGVEVVEISAAQPVMSGLVVMVVSANRNGVTQLDDHIYKRARRPGDRSGGLVDPQLLPGLIVVAIQDGLAGEKIPRDVRISLKAINELVPVIVLPRVHQWRQDPDKPASKSYMNKIKALEGAIAPHVSPANEANK